MKLLQKITVSILFLTFLFGPGPLFSQQHVNAEEEAHPETISEQQKQNTDSHKKIQDAHHAESDEDASHEEVYDNREFIMDHVKDSHEWHILTTKSGHHVSVPLPVILFSKHSGLNAFMSGKLAHGHTYNGFKYGEGDLSSKIVEVDAHGELLEPGLPLDFSITKNVFMMFLSVVILLWLFLALARSYRKTGISEPKGIQGFLEPLIVFIEEDVAIPNIGVEKYARYMPYLLTVFFFILANNLMGLIPFFPFGANVTGNIAVTMVLAIITFLITQFSGNKGYWRHVFNTPGVPFWLAPIMVPVEIIGLFTKPFALMIRLFANITAGHIIILSLISLIFVFKSIFLSIPSLIMVIFMDFIELLVAFLQAYIFTLLSALFIGLAMPEHHHD